MAKKKTATKTATKTEESTALVPRSESAFAIVRADTSIAEQVRDVGLTQFQLTRLKMPSGGGTSWEVPTLGGVEAAQEIEVVIAVVRSNIRQFYLVSFEESEGGAPPDCSSNDNETGFGVRDESGEEPSVQTCSDCPHAQWDSAKKGGGQACSEKKAILFFTLDSMLPMLLMVPPTSLKPVRLFAQELMTFGREYFAVVTRMTLEKVKGPPDYSVLQLAHVRDLSKEEIERMRAVSADLKQAFMGAPIAATPE